MEYPALELDWNLETAARVRFLPQFGQTLRTAYGFRIEMPIELSLRPVGNLKLVPVVSNLRAQLSFRSEGGEEAEVGVLQGAGVQVGSPYGQKITQIMTWSGPLSALVELERLRNGRPPQFRMQFFGDVAVILPDSQPGYEVSTVPKTVFKTGEIAYPAELWRDVLLKLKLADIVMIEIPIAESAPDGFGPVWNGLKHARDVFLQGGSFSWEASAAAVRNAIQHWENVEPSTGEKTKAGYPSKRERLLGLRQALKFYLSYSLHPEGVVEHQWTRDDALLGIAALSALLAVRKP